MGKGKLILKKWNLRYVWDIQRELYNEDLRVSVSAQESGQCQRKPGNNVEVHGARGKEDRGQKCGEDQSMKEGQRKRSQ